MCNEINRLISEQLLNYKEHPSNVLFEQIVDNARKLVYFMPKETMGVSEEECAEILLIIDSRIKAIILSYNPDYNDFSAFIFPIVSQHVRVMQSRHRIKQKRENYLLYGNSAYEFELSENNNSVENLIASEHSQIYGSDSSFLQRITVVFKAAPSSRARFFLYFISYAVEMSENTIKRYCMAFNINYPQTKKIMQLLSKADPNKERDKAEIEQAVEQRNRYFTKIIYLECMLADLNFLSDHSRDEELIGEINRIKGYSSNKQALINRKTKRVPRSLLSSVFNLCEGSVSVYMLYSKNLVSWCHDPDKNCQIRAKDMGISAKCKALVSDTKKSAVYSSEVLEEFRPIDHFNLKI